MNHTDHVNLLRPANLDQGGTWADFGAGSGAFSLALRELIGLHATIYAVDKDRSALNELVKAHRAEFGTSQNVHTMRADFAGALSLPPLDGIVMANSLHFFRDKEKVL
ncbi:MAG TPA: class I SAM-dependent methyltransferase, partial [Anaerolineales bacterium]|nr:class I SAM-dependent methyltransferase [Anaerolineales bacterium]